jgi:taurine dioxygenase
MSANARELSDAGALDVQRMSGYTGVSITGRAIRDMTDGDVKEVQRLTSEYCVAVLPEQFLTPGEQLAFVARLGPITVTPGVDLHPDFDNVHIVANRGEPGKPVSGGFHTDTCFVEKPPAYTSLSAVDIPDHGGDTVFCNQYVAYDGLSPVMKGLRLKHVVSGTARPEAVPDPVWHPAVRTNPVTGRKALYVTYAARCIEAEGMTKSEGDALINLLYQHSLANHAMYRHRWSPGDFVIWDNRCSLHAAVYDHGEQARTLYRVMCEGERPYEA